MAYNTVPTATYIHDFAERMQEEWGAQARVDEKAFKEAVTSLKPVEAAKFSPEGQGPSIRPLRMGFGAIAHKRNLATIAVPPFLRLNTPESGEDVRRLGSKLEAFLQGVWQRAPIEDVWTRQVQDMLIYGRGWSCLWANPRLWADKNYAEMVDDYDKLVEAPEKDEERRDIRRRMSVYKERNFPIRWLHADASSTWPQLSKERYLPEVVEMRKMTVEEIKADFGDRALPEGQRDGRGSTLLSVLVYTNHYHTAVVIDDVNDARLGPSWKHDYGMSPYIMAEGPILPSNTEGLRWTGTLYDYMDALEAFDQVMSDIRNLIRRYTLAPMLLQKNMDMRAQHGDTEIEYSSSRPIIELYPGEDMKLGPTPVMNAEVGRFVEFLQNYVMTLLLNPAQRGHLLSGTSAVSFATALQAAQVVLNAYTIPLQAAAVYWGKLAFRSIEILGETVTVVHSKAGRISASPKEVAGCGDLLQARIATTLPINRNAQMNLYTAAVNNGFPPDIAMELYLDIEAPEKVLDRAHAWKIRQALESKQIEQVLMLASELAQRFPAPDLAGLAQGVANLPPAAQAALAERGMPALGPGPGPGPGTVPGSPGALAQTQSNQRRAGVMQDMSQLGAQQIT